jgi:hypothetical protein
MVGGFIPEWRAASCRNGGRLHSGTVGGFKSEGWATSPGIRTLPREQPFVLALLLRIGRIGELIEAVRHDQSALRSELAPIRFEVVDRPLVLRPAPPPLDQVSRSRQASTAKAPPSLVQML